MIDRVVQNAGNPELQRDAVIQIADCKGHAGLDLVTLGDIQADQHALIIFQQSQGLNIMPALQADAAGQGVGLGINAKTSPGIMPNRVRLTAEDDVAAIGDERRSGDLTLSFLRFQPGKVFGFDELCAFPASGNVAAQEQGRGDHKSLFERDGEGVQGH